MQLLLSILRKNGLLFGFIFFEFISLFIYFSFNLFPNTIANGFFTSVGGSINAFNSNFTQYLFLKEQNKLLVTENIQLHKKIEAYNSLLKKTNSLYVKSIDSIKYKQQYTYLSAEIVKNSITNSKNFLLINKGIKNGIKQDMGIISSKGIIGIVGKTSGRYSSVISLLNTKTKINARIKNNGIFGSIIWDAKDPRYVSLIDIPRYQSIKIGDTIETDGKSSIFPEGIAIGKIYKIFKNEESSDYILKIKLFEDFNRVKQVYVVNNLDKIEIDSLTQQENREYAE